jgi:integrin alpha FG-GAP repeat containing protein 1
LMSFVKSSFWISGHLVALGDFDGNLSTDIFIYNQDKLTVYDSSSQEALFSIDIPNLLNAATVDINYDGYLDLIACIKTDSGFRNDIYLGNSSALVLDGSFDTTRIQSFILDLDGKMQGNILAYPQNDTNRVNSWSYKSQPNGQRYLAQSSTNMTLCQFSTPHSNSFIDLDGDCIADVFLTCESPNKKPLYQIWLNKGSQGFVLHGEFDGILGAGPITFADMDSDGTLDMVFYTCVRSHCSLNIVYNRQIPICSDSESSKCRPRNNLCISDPNFTFDFNVYTI